MLTQREYVRLKSRMTRAKNSGNPHKVIAEAEYAVNIFNAHGWPDSWPTWRNALEDASWKLRLRCEYAASDRADSLVDLLFF